MTRVTKSRKSARLAKTEPVGLLDMPSPWLQSLIREHLPDVEADDEQQEHDGPILQFFRSSMGCATTVLQHASKIQLELKPSNAAKHSHSQSKGRGSNNGNQGKSSVGAQLQGRAKALKSEDSSTKSRGRNKKGSSTGEISASEQLQARAKALQSIMSKVGSAELLITLVGDVLPLWEVLPKQNVSCLHLDSIILTSDMLLNQLQLQQCTKLQTLQLHGWSVQSTEKELAALRRNRTAWAPPSLTHLEITEHAAGSYPDLQPIARLLGPQVTHLQSPFPPLEEEATRFLTALTHVTTDSLCEWTLEALSIVPSLTHVSVSKLLVSDDHSNMQCKWQQLEIRDEVCFNHLLELPLRSIQKVLLPHNVVYGNVDQRRGSTQEDQQFFDELQSFGHIQVQPGVCRCPWGMLGFNISVECLDLSLEFCVDNAVTPTAAEPPDPTPSGVPNPNPNPKPVPQSSPSNTRELAISFSNFAAEAEFECLAITLENLPPTVTALIFEDFYMRKENFFTRVKYGDMNRVWKPVIAALPSHIKHLGIAGCGLHSHQGPVCAHARAIAAQLDDSQLHQDVCLEVVLLRGAKESEELKAVCREFPRVRLVRCCLVKDCKSDVYYEYDDE